MAYDIIRPSSREEWLEHRKAGIGSSEVATILGLNPYETPYQLWRRKLGLDEPKEETYAMRRGHYLEASVAATWEGELGRVVDKDSEGDWLIINKERPYLRVSPDRTYTLQDGSKGILECKTTNLRIDPLNVPSQWFTQLQYQLGVAELERGSIAWLMAGYEFGYIDLIFVPDFFERLVEEVDHFVNYHLGEQIAPELRNVSDVVLRYKTHVTGETKEASERTYEDWCDLKDVREEIAALTERKEQLEDKLKEAFGSAEALIYDGSTLATWKAPSKPTERIDTKALKEAHPELVAKFTTQTLGSRRLLIK